MVGEQERLVGNVFEVTLSVDYPPALAAAETDCLDDTLNYASLVRLVRDVMSEPSLLLEHVCGRIRRAVMAEFPDVTGGYVKVSKLLPPVAGVQMESASVVLRWDDGSR